MASAIYFLDYCSWEEIIPALSFEVSLPSCPFAQLFRPPESLLKTKCVFIEERKGGP